MVKTKTAPTTAPVARDDDTEMRILEAACRVFSRPPDALVHVRHERERVRGILGREKVIATGLL